MTDKDTRRGSNEIFLQIDSAARSHLADYYLLIQKH